jgi:hypothetical protein
MRPGIIVVGRRLACIIIGASIMAFYLWFGICIPYHCSAVIQISYPFLDLPRLNQRRSDPQPREEIIFYLFNTVLGIRNRIRMVFGPSGSINERFGSSSGSFPFLIKVLSGLK